MLIYLAISCGLIGLLFLYIRQKLQAFEMRINTISDILRQFTHELTLPVQQHINIQEPFSQIEDSDSESSDSDTESESESDSDHSDESVISHENLVETIQLEQPLETITLEDEKIEVSDDEDVKVVTLEKSKYDGLSVKELKEKVAELGGPSNLKTKKVLLEFLEKK